MWNRQQYDSTAIGRDRTPVRTVPRHRATALQLALSEVNHANDSASRPARHSEHIVAALSTAVAASDAHGTSPSGKLFQCRFLGEVFKSQLSKVPRRRHPHSSLRVRVSLRGGRHREVVEELGPGDILTRRLPTACCKLEAAKENQGGQSISAAFKLFSAFLHSCNSSHAIIASSADLVSLVDRPYKRSRRPPEELERNHTYVSKKLKLPCAPSTAINVPRVEHAICMYDPRTGFDSEFVRRRGFDTTEDSVAPAGKAAVGNFVPHDSQREKDKEERIDFRG
ncbi:hypothetical protein FB451DRAFT_1179079 [Mycena latifolia]|nr:hypothetical protein FB451DRAFT_1179079 [Mycena latifolia]